MERPVLTIKLYFTDWLLEFLAFAVIIVTIYFAINAYRNISIFDGHYRKHHYHNPQAVFIFPVLSVLIYSGFTLMNTIPHTFKYPVIITAENAEKEYHNGLVMLRVVKLTVMVVLLIMTFTIAQSI